MFFSNGLKDADHDAVHKQVLNIMRKTRFGKEPCVKEMRRAIAAKERS